MPVSDTSTEAQRVLTQLLAAKTPAERVNMVVAMRERAYSLQRAAYLHSHPNATDSEVHAYILRTRFGREAAEMYLRQL